MTHYAHVIDGIVEQVIVAEQEHIDTLDDPENWIQTSYNTHGGVNDRPGGESLRYNFAGIGMTYDEVRDAFIPRQLYESWILNEDTCLFEPPFPEPDDGKEYVWEEREVDWVEVSAPGVE